MITKEVYFDLSGVNDMRVSVWRREKEKERARVFFGF